MKGLDHNLVICPSKTLVEFIASGILGNRGRALFGIGMGNTSSCRRG